MKNNLPTGPYYPGVRFTFFTWMGAFVLVLAVVLLKGCA